MKRSKRCKVEYVDNIETSFEVKCAEIKVCKYKIYGKTKTSGYQLLTTKNDKQKAIDYANNLNPNTYIGRLVIEHNKETDTDTPIDLGR